MKFSLAFSPCPNDTFIFDALVNQKIDTQGISFEVHLEDVQTLNEWAIAGKMDFSKISYGVWSKVKDQYHLMNSGGALGKGVGPLLITRPAKFLDCSPEAINEMTIAIPGENTTAHLLFSLAYPKAKKKVFKVFHEIENAVLNGEVDAGVIIHENRFTYEAKGLRKIIDLGNYWEQTKRLPIPPSFYNCTHLHLHTSITPSFYNSKAHHYTDFSNSTTSAYSCMAVYYDVHVFVKSVLQKSYKFCSIFVCDHTPTHVNHFAVA